MLAAAFAACALGSGCRPLATVGGTMLMALTFFASGTYQGGNRVEEFGASFVLIGLALRQCVSPVIGTEGRIFLLGVVCLGCAPLLQEPFVLSIAPWLVHDLWGRWVSGGDRMRAIVAYATALTCPAVIVIAGLALLADSAAGSTPLPTTCLPMAKKRELPQPSFPTPCRS